ncbi:MAG: hypothetical protein HQ512_11130 [Rhodospirillales bacterium]|nr:hypothetical protein [Rhodospirillales bacterium]
MIPTLREIVSALYGAYRLARFDPSGLDYFDQSIAGFWRSFFAAVLIAPVYLFLLMIRYSKFTEDVWLFRFLAIETIVYVIAWVTFPLAMVYLAKAFEREEFYIRFIVAYNWAGVLQNAIYLPIGILGTAGLVSLDNANAMGLVALSLILIYNGFIARTALNVSVGAAAGLVGLDFLISVFLNAMADGVL